MDLSSLMGGIRPLTPTDHARKTAALRAGFQAAGIAAPVSFEAFVAAMPPSLTGACLGSDAEDFYLTSLLAPALLEDCGIDAVAAAVLQHITLQLNFMTRFLAHPAGPECVVLDGDPRLFPLALANHNVVAGIQLSPDPIDYPAWTRDNADVKLDPERLTSATIETIPAILARMGRNRIGCLYIELPADRSVTISERYATLANHVAADTFYVLGGSAARLLDAVARLEQAYPDAMILVRLYDIPRRGASERRAIVVASGIPNLPALTIDCRQERVCTIVPQSQSTLAREVRYRNGGQGEQHEWVKIKRPAAIRSRTPLPEEARRRISDDQLFPHAATILRGGTLVPWTGFNCNTFLHVTDRGELISDVGEMNTHFAPDLHPANDEPPSFTLPLDRVLNVKGAAMPLTFTPGLHTFFSHFMLQCFPRVRILRDLGSDAKVIVDENIRPKQLEMLHRVGIGPERIVLRPQGVAVRADELIVPRPWPLVFSPYTLEIYEELVASAAPRSQPVGRRILISREYRSTWRTMLTYPAIAQMLRDRYGFEETRPELLSLDEEIHLYRDARMVIGAEGAGLYSAVYAQPGATYVSIGDEDYIMPVLGSAASVRGFDVAYIFGESLRATSDVERRLPSGHADYMVDPLAVAGLLDQLL